MIETLEKCVHPYILKDGRIFKCGQCQLCKRSKSQEWTARVIHELNTMPNKKAVFVTLTYHPKFLPKCDKSVFIPQAIKDRGGNLCKEDMVKFMKRLRKITDKMNRKIKYIYCGEYGGLNKRPHYHAIIMGIDAEEAQKMQIAKLWGKGIVDIDKRLVDSKAIKYVLGYVRKKIGQEDEVYEEIGRIKPYQRQSQGLGKTWALRNVKSWALTGSICVDDYQQAIPRYYREKVHEKEGVKIKYSSISIQEFQGFTITKINKNNYKVVRNVYGTFTREIRQNQLQKTLSNIDNHKHINNYDVDYDYYKSILFNQYKEQFKNHYKLYKDFIDSGRDLQLLGEQLTKKNVRDGGYELEKRNKKRTRKYIPYIDERIASIEDQKKMRSVAKNKELEYLTSPFGWRDKLPDEELEERFCTL